MVFGIVLVSAPYTIEIEALRITHVDSILPCPENQSKFSGSLTFQEKMTVDRFEKNSIIAGMGL